MHGIDDLVVLIEAPDENSWSNALFDIAKQNGFSQTVYGVVPDKKQPLENAFLRSNYSPAWRQIYDSAKLHYIDPTVTHCLKSTTPLIWAPDTFQSGIQKQFYEEACGYGLRSGVTYPIHGPNNEFGVISFVSDASAGKAADRDLSHALAELALVRDFVFESSIRFVKRAQQPNDGIYLTKRELECLKWAMAGKSSWEISMILNRSEATINFHIANIKHKFQVSTRQQAIVKAIRIGLLLPD
jgi:LuxR family quorum-sensing transcriptional regulator LasR